MAGKILLVDDEPRVLSGLRRHLSGSFELETAQGAEAGLELLRTRGPFAVVLSDMRMPGMNGVEFLSEVKRRSPDTIRMVLTGDADLSSAQAAVNRGSVFRFLTKPCPREVLIEALREGLEQHEIRLTERKLLEDTVNGIVRILAGILEGAAPKALGTSMAYHDDAIEIARSLGVEASWEVETALLLSQIGRLTLPGELQAKLDAGDRLTEAEEELVGLLPEIGWRLLEEIPRMEGVARIVRYQAKGFDGSGLPDDEVAGEEIPLGARILKVLLDLGKHEERGEERTRALQGLWRVKERYDPAVLGAVSALAVDTGRAAESKRPPRKVSFRELRPGNVLAGPIITEDGRCIVREGHRLSLVSLERLRSHHKVSHIREPILIEDPWEEFSRSKRHLVS